MGNDVGTAKSPLWLRVTSGLLVSSFILLLVVLILNLVFGWGVGWAILGWYALGLGGALVLLLLVSVWSWVWRGW